MRRYDEESYDYRRVASQSGNKDLGNSDVVIALLRDN